MATRLMLSGNYCALIDVDQDGGIQLIPAATFEVAGRSFREDTWSYKLELPTPSSHEPIKRVVPRQGVVHISHRRASFPALGWEIAPGPRRGGSPGQYRSIATG